MEETNLRKIGYVRVSSQSQNEERQLKQLNEIGMDIIYKDNIRSEYG